MGQLVAKFKKAAKLNESCKTSDLNITAIPNRYESMSELTKALHDAGLEKCNLLVAIDFTKSNLWQGEKTFGGLSLHHVPKDTYELVEGEMDIVEHKDTSQAMQNPYQRILGIVQKPLNEFDEDKRIPTCIFGYARPNGAPYVLDIYDSEGFDKAKGCHGMEGVLQAYEQAVQKHSLSGGTMFSPVLHWAKKKVEESKNEYHILIILGDGNIEDMSETQAKLAELSRTCPLSVIFVGVGDGSDPQYPTNKWVRMQKLDDEPTGDCDIWQSVYLANIQAELSKSQHPDVELATMMLMEIPDQYKYFQKRGMIH
jgi:E3 ubiquitin-protein ligase RGLG